MKKSRFTETQIVSILKQADAGLPVKDLCRQAGISVATYYQWKSKYGGLEASELRRVKELEAENARLKRTCQTIGCRQPVSRLSLSASLLRPTTTECPSPEMPQPNVEGRNRCIAALHASEAQLTLS